MGRKPTGRPRGRPRKTPKPDESGSSPNILVRGADHAPYFREFGTYTVPIDGDWFVFTNKQRNEWLQDGKRDYVEHLEHEISEYVRNPMSRFLAHGVPWHAEPVSYAGGRIVLPASEYPQEYLNDGIAFQNDWTNDYVMLKAPRKAGKSLAGAIKVGRIAIKTYDDWPCFSGAGKWRLDFRDWDGPTTIIVASFSWTNVKELWEVYREMWPRDELGPYAPDWGMYPGEEGKPKNMSFGDGRPKVFEPRISGGRVVFLCYTQPQAVWENFKAKVFHADEQPPLNLLNAFEDGSRTMGDYTPAIFTWSGFVLKERPDTGLAGPLAKIWSGKMTRGRKTIGRYNLDVPSTPDAIISQKKKDDLYDLYANPALPRDRKTERRGLACYYPGDEPGGGLVFDADYWQREVHIVNPLWDDDKTPQDGTKWRVIDYADRKTTCCSWWYVGPVTTWWGEQRVYAFLYRVMYEQNMSVFDAAKTIIEMSHNKMVEGDPEEDESGTAYYKTFNEVQCSEQFFGDVIDGRICKYRHQGGTIMASFHRYGIEALRPASAQHNRVQIPLFKEWLRIDWDEPHPFRRGDDGEKVMGCPKLFVFDGRGTQHAIDEMEGMPEPDPDKPDEGNLISKDFPHDFIDTAKYWASDEPRYMGAWCAQSEAAQERDEHRNDPMRDDGQRHSDRGTVDAAPFTGYGWS